MHGEGLGIEMASTFEGNLEKWCLPGKTRVG